MSYFNTENSEQGTSYDEARMRDRKVGQELAPKYRTVGINMKYEEISKK